MEGIGGVIKRRAEDAKRKPERKNSHLPGIEMPQVRTERYMHSDAHVLAAEISAYFSERKKFAVYLATIRRMGVPQARALFSSIKSGDANVHSPRKFFMWVSRNEGASTPVPASKKRVTAKKPKKTGNKQLDMNDFLG